MMTGQVLKANVEIHGVHVDFVYVVGEPVYTIPARGKVGEQVQFEEHEILASGSSVANTKSALEESSDG